MQDSSITLKIIEASLERLSSVGRYAAIMEMLPHCNVATDMDFQKRYVEFYKLKRYSKEFRARYFSFMEKNKGNTALCFETIAAHLRDINSTVEASFSSKLLHTINPHFPAWDKWIGQATGISIPPSKNKDKKEQFETAVKRYGLLTAWFKDYIAGEPGKQALCRFDEYFPRYQTRITAVKKVELILWQMRGAPTLSTL
jgi:hypothetical protein